MPNHKSPAFLDDLLPDWLVREPDNLYVAVFMPLILRRDDELLAGAPQAWQAIRQALLPTLTRAALERMLECWLIERFPTLTMEELRAMLSVLTPLEQTRAYQEIFAKGQLAGEARGEARGKAEGKAEMLKLQLTRRFGRLPRWAATRVENAAMAQLDQWLTGIFDAQSLEEVLSPGPRKGLKSHPH